MRQVAMILTLLFSANQPAEALRRPKSKGDKKRAKETLNRRRAGLRRLGVLGGRKLKPKRERELRRRINSWFRQQGLDHRAERVVEIGKNGPRTIVAVQSQSQLGLGTHVATFELSTTGPARWTSRFSADLDSIGRLRNAAETYLKGERVPFAYRKSERISKSGQSIVFSYRVNGQPIEVSVNISTGHARATLPGTPENH
jgi:hypothetical protein